MIESPDPLDSEVSVSVDVNESGVTAKSKSRLISGLDRLLGNLSDWANVRLEGDIRARRATSTANEKVIGALADYAVDKLKVDPGFAERALASHVDGILRSQNNREKVAQRAIEDLRREPPSDEQARSGPDEISAEVLDRLETYSSGASTEELQERWGRVLASEIRKPGAFSLKVLRIIDELDSDTAALFEDFATHRVGEFVPKVLVGEFPYDRQLKLVDAGLLVDPNFGQSSSFSEIDIEADKYWFWRANQSLICLPRADFTPKREFGSKSAISTHDNKPAVPIYILTSAGIAITTILPPVDNSRPYYLRAKEKYPTASRWKVSADEKSVARIE